MAFDFEKNLDMIERSVKSMDMDCYCSLVGDCLNALRAGKQIVVTGLGKNMPVCEKFVSSMNSVGLNAAFLHTSEAFHGDMGLVKDGDVVIVLSKSGRTPETLLLVEKLKLKATVILWAITFEADAELCKKVDKCITLSLEQEGGPWNIMPMNSTVVTLFLLQGIIIDLVNTLGVTLNDFRSNHPGGGIGQKLLNT